jgi:hypothetical protein
MQLCSKVAEFVDTAFRHSDDFTEGGHPRGATAVPDKHLAVLPR